MSDLSGVESAAPLQGCRGFFSTHLHEMLELDKNLQNTVRQRPAPPRFLLALLVLRLRRSACRAPYAPPVGHNERPLIAGVDVQVEKRMQVVRDAEGRLRPTWQMLDGRRAHGCNTKTKLFAPPWNDLRAHLPHLTFPLTPIIWSSSAPQVHRVARL